MTRADLLIASSTIWVVVTAVLVMFMQAGFAFLEAGLTRMKNVGHIAGKTVLVFGIASVVYYLVGFGIAFGDGGGGFVGGSGFVPSVQDLIQVGKAPFSLFAEIPGAAGYLFEVVFAGVSLAIVWGAMAERTKLWVYFAFGVYFILIYSIVSHWIWGPNGWLLDKGMQDFAGSTVVHFQGALAALAGAILLGPRIGKFDKDGKPNAIPGHNMAFVTLGVLILWFGWFGFNPGSTLSVDWGGVGYFGYVALTTNIAAACGAIGGVATAWIVLKKPDLSMMLNGVIAALVAITAASGYVAPWAAIVIGLVAGAIAVVGVLFVERLRIDDPVGAVAVHGMSGIWGTLATGLFAVPLLAGNLGVGTGGLVYTGSFHQLGVQALGIVAVGGFTFTASFLGLWAMKKTVGIRVEPEVETAGLDVSEHGMWGYPEFYIPVPGGYGTEMHGHLVAAGTAHAAGLRRHQHDGGGVHAEEPPEVEAGETAVEAAPAEAPSQSR
jgi:Amt family ammonium transporter